MLSLQPHASTKPVIATEAKYVSLASAAYGCDTTGSVTALNLVAEGTDNTNRIGRHIRTRYLRMRGYFSVQAANVNTNLCRVLLVYDGQPNGALPTVNTILDAATSISNYNVDCFERFKILSDQLVSLGGVSNAATQSYALAPNTSEYKVDLNLDLDTKYILTTGVIGAVESGAVLLVTIGSQAAGSAYNLTAASQLLFTDL